MSKPKGSVGIALAIAVLIIVAVTSLGYYQFVLCKPTSCSTSTSSSATTAAAACAPPSCVTVQINQGAATLTTTAFTPDVVTLVIGVNNSFQFHNNDSQSFAHTATADSCSQAGQPCPFDTGVFDYNATSKMFTITAPGTYPYFCSIHPTTMVGKIVVVAGSGSGAAASSSSVSTSASTSNAAPANGFAISIPKGSSTDQSSPGYRPDNVTLVVGANNTVTWTNNDAVGHIVTFTSIPSGAVVPNSDLVGPSGTFTVTLTVPGTYHYFDTLFGWMKGTIIVKSG